MVQQTDTVIFLVVTLILLLLFPVKLSASLFGARHDTLLFSLLALITAVPFAYVTYELMEIGYIGAYFGMVIAFFIVLRTTIAGAFIIPAFAMIISAAVIQGLSSFGLIQIVVT